MHIKTIQKISMIQIVYLLAVIIFGAYVRASGSGAGCGSHWPLCNGEVLPSSPQVQTIIEFTHRVTSGLTLPFALMVYLLIRKSTAQLTWARSFSLLTIAFLLIEGLLGAGLVRYEHVAENKSTYRALSMSLHLINTFALMACAIATSYFIQPLKTSGQTIYINFIRPYLWLMGTCILLIGLSGAITALGDTLFPVRSPGEALTRGLTSSEHLFVKLRIYHPFIAMFCGALIIHICRKLARFGGAVQSFSQLLTCFILIQFFIGFMNVKLFAPTWLQLIHLLFAQFIWMTFILIVALLKSPMPNSVAHDRRVRTSKVFL